MLYHHHILMGWLAILLYSICSVAIPCQVEELSKWKTALKLKTNSPSFSLNELPGRMRKHGYPWVCPASKNRLWKSLDKGKEIRCFYYFIHKTNKYVTGVLEFLLFILSVPSWEWHQRVTTLLLGGAFVLHSETVWFVCCLLKGRNGNNSLFVLCLSFLHP